MRIKTVKRYYCDFCKKSGGSSYHIKNHEIHCTLNPERKCRLCARIHGSNGHDLKTLLSILGDGNNKSFENLWDHVEGCPACILATLRQSKYLEITDTVYSENHANYEKAMSFNFKDALASFWSDVNGEGYL